MLPECNELLLDHRAGILTVTLNRPYKRNAMNAELVAELISVFEAIHDDRGIRAVVLGGAEKNFCAGGDISSLNKSGDGDSKLPARENPAWQFNRNFGHMITMVNNAPQVVIALLEGVVLGGGLGLACICDVAIADENAKFAMPETGLGIIPAQIAPFVVQRVGLTQARRLSLLGESIDGNAAYAMGMVHYLTRSADEMQSTLHSVLKSVKRRAPEATAKTKELILQVGQVELEALLDTAADMFATALSSEEGQEGTAAFLEKRRPDWAI